MPHPDTIRLVLVLIALVALLGMFRRPFYGVISYLIIMMTRPGLFYPILGQLRIELLVGILIISVMALSPTRLRRIQLKTDSITRYMFLLIVVMGLSMLQAIDFKTSWAWMYQFSRVFLFFIMIITLIDDKKDVEILLVTFSLLTTFFAYDAIYNYAHGKIITRIAESEVTYAITSDGLGQGHVALANTILQGMPILWYVFICNRAKVLKYSGVLLFPACLYGVVISGSRGGFVGLIALFICLTALTKHRFLMVAAGVLFILSLPLFSTSGYLDYMSSILNLSDVSGSSRITGLRHGLEMLVKRPLLGVGPGCYPVARKIWFHWGLWAHNHYGQLLGELGLIGTIVWFVFLKNYLLKTWRYINFTGIDPKMKNISYAILVASIVRLVLGMGSHSLYIFFWYMIAGIVVVEKRLLNHPDKQHNGVN